MNFFDKISQIFSSEQKSTALTLSDTAYSGGSIFERLGLSRPAVRIRCDENSAFAAYRSHELVFACINKLSDVANDAEIIVEEKNAKGEWQKKEGHLLTALFKRPNQMQTGRDIRKLMVQSEQGAGRFCIILNRSGAGIPVEMEIVNPNRITPKFDSSREKIVAYEYTRKDGRKVLIDPKNILIRRRVDLLDQFNGFAPATAALKSVNSDLGLTDYVDAFFESDGTPSGILKILNANLNDTRKDELVAKWRQKYTRGGSNQKGIAVLDANADYQKIGSNLDELASEPLSDRFESRICSVFGVPPVLVGALVGLRHSTNNATARAALRDFWDNKVSPELATLREWLTWFALPEFEDIEQIKAEKIRVGYDISQAAFLQEDVNEIHDRARKNYQTDGWTKNEFREATGKKPVPDGDKFRSDIIAANKPEPAQLPAKETEKDAPKQLPVSTEKKTFDFDGLTLGRAPVGVELVINLKSLASDFESEREKITRILTKFRGELIEQAARDIDNLTPENVHELVLTPNQKAVKQINKTLQSAFSQGRAQIIAEINAQKTAKNLYTSHTQTKDLFDDDDDDFISRLSDITVSKLINEIQSRAINIYVALQTLKNFTVELLKEKLAGESAKFVETSAGIAANAAISSGRKFEMEARSEEIKYFTYSAILDRNTCESCESADEMQADSIDELPDAPNPECEGGAMCRCFIVAVVE